MAIIMRIIHMSKKFFVLIVIVLISSLGLYLANYIKAEEPKAAEPTTEAEYSLKLRSSEPKIRFGKPAIPPTNEPYSGNAKLTIEETGDVKDVGVVIITIEE